MRNKVIHPYLEKGFWDKPKNQFWNTDSYSEKSKRKIELGLNVRF